MKCPECGATTRAVTYACNVHGCNADHFCCVVCLLSHMHRHLHDRNKRIAELEVRAEKAEARKAEMGVMVLRLWDLLSQYLGAADRRSYGADVMYVLRD